MLIIKEAKTTPIRIDIDLQTDVGRVQGFFVGHGFIRTKPQMAELQERLAALQDENMPPIEREERILRELYESFDGLANASGEALKGDEAFSAVTRGSLSVQLTQAASDAYWAFMSGARQGNSRPARAR
jgi:hypothetical protein